MKLIFSIVVSVAGLYVIIFSKREAKKMLKYYPPEEHAKWLKIGRVAYVLIGIWMVLIASWAGYRSL